MKLGINNNSKNNSPYVYCKKHGTCRLDCASPCNTKIIQKPDSNLITVTIAVTTTKQSEKT